MLVLGVVPGTKDIRWAMLDGTQSEPRLIESIKKSEKLPIDEDQSTLLYDLKRFVGSALLETSVEHIMLLGAGTSQFKTSPLRLKVECVFQIAAKEADIPINVIPPQTLRAKEKKFSSIAGGTPEEILNGGNDFSPIPWRDAVLVAWCGLDK